MTRAWWRRAALVGLILGLGLLLHESSRRLVLPTPPAERGPAASSEDADPNPFLDPVVAAAARPGQTAEVRFSSRPTVLQEQDGLIRTGNEFAFQEFRPEGVRVFGDRGYLDFSLRDIRIGAKSLRSGGWLSDGKPAVERGTSEHVVYRRGSVTEKYALLDQGVEQIFVLGSDLAALQREGDLTVTVALDSPLKRMEKLRSRGAKEDSLEFTDGRTASILRYGGATAIDADGRRHDLNYNVRGNELAMVLDAGFLSTARFPLTIDPPVVSVSPLALTFSAPLGGPNPAPQRVQLTNAGTGQLKWVAVPSVPWVICSPAQGARQTAQKKNVNVSVNVIGLPAGHYTPTISFNQKTGGGAPVVVQLDVFVNSGPTVLLTPTSLAFNAPGVGPNPVPQTVTVQNVGPGTLTWDASASTTSGGTWLSVSPIHGNLAPGAIATLTVSVNHGVLADNTYNGTISVANNSVPAVVPPQPVQTCSVSLTVSSNPVIVLSPAAGLSFDVPSAGGTGIASLPMTVTNGGGGTLNWTAVASVTTPAAGTWLAVSPTTGALSAGASAPLTVTVTRGALAAGSYDGLITVTATGGVTNSPQSIPITLNVDPIPTITLNPTSLVFTAAQGGSPPGSQIVTLTNSGAGTLNWTQSTLGGATWLTVSPTSGTLGSGASTQLTVSVNQGTMPVRSLTETITITDPNATNPTELVFVELDIINTPAIGLSPTSFTFNAPLNGSAPPSQPLTVTNTGSGTLAWTATPSDPWIQVTPSGSSLGAGAFATPAISVNQGVMAAGTYTGSILIADPNASNNPQTVSVTMVINANPTIGFSPASLTFNAPLGGAAPPPQGLTITNVGDGLLTWSAAATVPWITSITPSGGTLTDGASTTPPISVTVNQGALAAGSYSGSIIITAGGATNTPQTVPVTLNVNNSPTIGLSSTSFSFTAAQGGTPPATQQVTITNVGTGTLHWVGTPSDPSWLSISAAAPAGLGPNAFETATITVNQGSKPAGVYNATIAISDSNASNSPQTISVSLTVSSQPTIGVAPTTFTFSGPLGGAAPAGQPVTITNTGGGTLNWSSLSSDTSWLTITSAGGALTAGASATPTINVDQTTLPPGTTNGTITISDPLSSNVSVQINVSFNVLTTPTIGLSPTTLTFSAFVGGASPGSQTVTLSNVGTGTLSWTATPADPWVIIAPPTSGSVTTTPATLTISVDITGLAAGGHSSSITINAPGASNDGQLITITLSLLDQTVTITLPKAGYCGATGLELLLPLALIWGYRRLRRNGRTLPVSLGRLGIFLAVLILGSAQAWADEDDLPRSLQQEEPPPRPSAPVPPQAQGEEEHPDALDCSKTALEPHLGFLTFSSKFKDHAKFCGGLGVRVPSPLLSSSLGSDPDRVALFLDLSVSSINRDIPTTTGKSGTLLFVSLGTDVAFYHDEDLDTRVLIGGQYGYFGGVKALDNGFAFLVGLRGALNLGGGIWLVLTPEIALAKASNHIFFLNLGVDIGF